MNGAPNHTICEWRCEVCGGEIHVALWEGMPQKRCQVCCRIVCSSCIAKFTSLRTRRIVCKPCAQRLKNGGHNPHAQLLE